MAGKTIIPQNGDALRELRDQRSLPQTRMATELENVLYQQTGLRYSIQQSDVSRLEHESMPLDMPKLLAYIMLCDANSNELLKDNFSQLFQKPDNIHLHEFSDNDSAEKQLLEFEKDSRIIVSPEFPSSFFRLNKKCERFKQINAADYEATEIYTSEAFLQFLFSPISLYSLDNKAQILKDCIDYFQESINHNLYFFSAACLPSLSQLPTMLLLPQKETLLISAPINFFHAGDAFIEISDNKSYRETASFYSKLPTVENSIIYLRIGLETLEKIQGGCLAREAIIYFGKEIMRTRDSNAMAVIKSFSPEIQAMIQAA